MNWNCFPLKQFFLNFFSRLITQHRGSGSKLDKNIRSGSKFNVLYPQHWNKLKRVCFYLLCVGEQDGYEAVGVDVPGVLQHAAVEGHSSLQITRPAVGNGQ